MKIIRLSSGLGNQMYQYALYLILKKKSANIYLYSDNNLLNEHNGLELNRIFKNISITNAKLISAYFLIFPLLNRMIYAFEQLKLFKLSVFLKKIEVITFPMADRYIFDEEDLVLLNKVFSFPPFDDLNNLECLKSLTTTNSVSVHIRRGDYISSKQYRRTHGNVCNIDYYKECIKYINSKVEFPVFFIFSDDVDWAKKEMQFSNAYYINHNIGMDSYKDMQLMSLCKHNIIANSTFSAWGAILNRNPSKIVLAPDKWVNDVNDKIAEKLVFSSWVLIDNRTPIVALIVNNCILTRLDIDNIIKQTHTDFLVVCDTLVGDDRFITPLLYTRKCFIEIAIDFNNLMFFSDRRWLEKEIFTFYEKTEK